MAKANSEYREWLNELQSDYSAQAKELAMPVAIDVAGMLTGWWLGKQMGRSSLLLGFLTYAGGKVHTLHENIRREQERIGIDYEENKPALSGFNPLYNNPNRVYHGESPLVSIGMGMMIGGAFSADSMNGIGGEELSATDKAKNAFSDIKEDLKHRLYLDKIFQSGENNSEKKKEENPVNGVSEVDLFIAGDKLGKEIDFSKLDQFDRQIENEAVNFQNKGTPQKQTATATAYNNVMQQADDDLLNGFSTTRIM
jgi:hypothetical protein